MKEDALSRSPTPPIAPNTFGDAIPIKPLAFHDLEKLTQSLRGADVLNNTYWVRFNLCNPCPGTVYGHFLFPIVLLGPVRGFEAFPFQVASKTLVGDLRCCRVLLTFFLNDIFGLFVAWIQLRSATQNNEGEV